MGDTMPTATDTIHARHSVRAFADRPVERATLEEILSTAARAPSGGNLQPWFVDALTGKALDEVKERVRASLAEHPRGEGTEFPIYPEPLGEPWRSRRRDNGDQLYGSLGIAREDKPARRAQFAKNYDFFGAPVGLFFSLPRAFGPPQWAHLGMYLENVMLLAAERGLGTCSQESWAAVHKTVAAFLGLPADRTLYCGMALGWPDEAHPINNWRTPRAPLEDFASFRGF